MKLALVLLMFTTSAFAGRFARWVNNYDQPLNFKCPSSQSIGTITRVNHDNKHEDRVWDFNCKNTFSKSGSCFWSGDVNQFDAELHYTCPFGSVISGVSSYHDNRKEDRRWKFWCCQGNVKIVKNCQWTDYLNHFDQYLKWIAASNRYLVGVSSYHDNSKEDRRWKVYTCEK